MNLYEKVKINFKIRKMKFFLICMNIFRKLKTIMKKKIKENGEKKTSFLKFYEKKSNFLINS